LTTIAAELGFRELAASEECLTGQGQTTDFGTLLCPRTLAGGHINRWFARYEEAAEARGACQGYLLAYRRSNLVVDRYYVEDLGLDRRRRGLGNNRIRLGPP